MNELQKKEFEILEQFHAICEENGLKYYLAYGSAIGAVRHKGFIPWDDDMDVVMLRDDYDKLIDLSKSIIPDDLFLQTYEVDHEYPFFFSKLRKRGTAFVEKGTEDLNINHGIFIDIFPLDYIPQNKINKFRQQVVAEKLWIMMAKTRIKSGAKKLLVQILNIGLNETSYIAKVKKLENKMKSYSKGKTSKVALLTYGGFAPYAMQYFDVNDLEPMKILFENKEFYIMKGYDKVLRESYGDYMTPPPLDKQIPLHDYYFLSFNEEYIPEKK